MAHLPTVVCNTNVFEFVKQDLRKDVESGVDLGSPDGILINGLGPYRYDSTLVSDGITYQVINVEPGMFLRFFKHKD